MNFRMITIQMCLLGHGQLRGCMDAGRQYKDALLSYLTRKMGNSMLKERRAVGRLFFNRALPILVGLRLYVETGPQSLEIHACFNHMDVFSLRRGCPY